MENSNQSKNREIKMKVSTVLAHHQSTKTNLKGENLNFKKKMIDPLCTEHEASFNIALGVILTLGALLAYPPQVIFFFHMATFFKPNRFFSAILHISLACHFFVQFNSLFSSQWISIYRRKSSFGVAYFSTALALLACMFTTINAVV